MIAITIYWIIIQIKCCHTAVQRILSIAADIRNAVHVAEQPAHTVTEYAGLLKSSA